MAANDAPTVKDETFVIPISTWDNHSLLLLEAWGSDTLADGTKVDLYRSWSTTSIIVEVEKPDGTKIKQSLSINDLLSAWLKTMNTCYETQYSSDAVLD